MYRATGSVGFRRRTGFHVLYRTNKFIKVIFNGIYTKCAFYKLVSYYLTSLTMKSWLETASGMDEATLSCMLAEPREALLPIRGRENLAPKKRDRSLEPCALSEEAYLSSSGGSPCTGLSREERRRRRRATLKYRTAHATRERIRVEAFNAAFASLRRLLPTLPPDKKLSKIEILRLAICYIAYLNHVLDA